MGNKSHFFFILKELSFFKNPQNSGHWQGGEPVTSPPLTTILRIFKERYLFQDEDKTELIAYQFLQKNPENRFMKFPTVKFSLVFELFDEEKKTHVILHKGYKFWPQAIAEIGGNLQPIRNDSFFPPKAEVVTRPVVQITAFVFSLVCTEPPKNPAS